MKKQFNIAIRKAAEKNHLYLWEVANLLGLSYSGFLSKMRHEWTPEEQQKTIKLIEDYALNNAEEDHV